jgi:hypothetical protein
MESKECRIQNATLIFCHLNKAIIRQFLLAINIGSKRSNYEIGISRSWFFQKVSFYVYFCKLQQIMQ